MFFVVVFFFFFKQKTAYEMLRSLVGSEMCIRDSAIKPQHTQFLVDMFARELVRAAPWRLMSFAQKIAHSVIDMSINSLTRRCERAMGEVSSPTAQKAVESVSYTHLRAHETPEHLVCRL